MDLDLQDSFTIPLTEAEAWAALLDLERVGACMPGAILESVEGDNFAGSVRLRIGPIQANYRGAGSFVDRDDTTRRAVIEASGRDTKAAGTAKATVALSLEPTGAETRVMLDMRLSVTGKPAQFGKGVIRDVTTELLQRFAANLAAELARADTPSPHQSDTASVEQSQSIGATPQPRPTAETSLNVLALVAGPILARVRVPGIALALVVLGVWAGRRRP